MCEKRRNWNFTRFCRSPATLRQFFSVSTALIPFNNSGGRRYSPTEMNIKRQTPIVRGWWLPKYVVGVLQLIGICLRVGGTVALACDSHHLIMKVHDCCDPSACSAMTAATHHLVSRPFVTNFSRRKAQPTRVCSRGTPQAMTRLHGGFVLV